MILTEKQYELTRADEKQYNDIAKKIEITINNKHEEIILTSGTNLVRILWEDFEKIIELYRNK